MLLYQANSDSACWNLFVFLSCSVNKWDFQKLLVLLIMQMEVKKEHKLSPSGSTFYFKALVLHKLSSQYYHETTTFTSHRQFSKRRMENYKEMIVQGHFHFQHSLLGDVLLFHRERMPVTLLAQVSEA